MRILHTADWHLGHTLRGHSRQREHEHFLGWLVDTVVERRVDAVLIAGDVFDSANPPPFAWRLWFEFLGALRRRRPGVQVVVIAGNHDSAARLEAPRDLLAAFDVHVLGRVRRDADGRLLADQLLIPLVGVEDSEARALVVAIPFLRASDVAVVRDVERDGAERDGAERKGTEREGGAGESKAVAIPRAGESVERHELGSADGDDPLIVGMRALHSELFEAARSRLESGQALVAMAHGYLVGGMLSELSERKVLGGNQHALPVDLFPDDCDYVALGHLHRPQKVAMRENVRYCGSPIPLSMPEREHPHHVVFADLADGALEKVWSLRVPRLVPLLRIPERGELEPEAAMAAVAALPARDAEDGLLDEDLRPLLEIAVRVPEPMPSLAERLVTAAADRDVRLARIELKTTAAPSGGEPDGSTSRDLATLLPEELFRLRYAREHEGAVPKRLLAAFRELVDEVENGSEVAP